MARSTKDGRETSLKALLAAAAKQYESEGRTRGYPKISVPSGTVGSSWSRDRHFALGEAGKDYPVDPVHAEKSIYETIRYRRRHGLTMLKEAREARLFRQGKDPVVTLLSKVHLWNARFEYSRAAHLLLVARTL